MTLSSYFDQVAVFLPLILSAILLLLAILVWQKVSFDARAQRDAVDGDADKLSKFASDITRISGYLQLAQEPERAVSDSPAAQSVADVLAAYRTWGKVLGRSIDSTKYSGWIDQKQNELQSILERVRQTGSRHDRQLGERDQRSVSDIVYLAIEKTDREIDSERKHRELQTALGTLVSAARMQFVDPRPGSTYFDSFRGVTVKIRKVWIRGLCDSGGQILHKLEYEEAR